MQVTASTSSDIDVKTLIATSPANKMAPKEEGGNQHESANNWRITSQQKESEITVGAVDTVHNDRIPWIGHEEETLLAVPQKPTESSENIIFIGPRVVMKSLIPSTTKPAYKVGGDNHLFNMHMSSANDSSDHLMNGNILIGDRDLEHGLKMTHPSHPVHLSFELKDCVAETMMQYAGTAVMELIEPSAYIKDDNKCITVVEDDEFRNNKQQVYTVLCYHLEIRCLLSACIPPCFFS